MNSELAVFSKAPAKTQISLARARNVPGAESDGSLMGDGCIGSIHLSLHGYAAFDETVGNLEPSFA